MNNNCNNLLSLSNYSFMKKYIQLTDETFGQRLRRLRLAKGFSQTELAKRIGVSSRVLAYYELETKHPPTAYLLLITKALTISVDELLGIKQYKGSISPKNTRLWNKLRKVEELPPKDQKTILSLIDAVISKQLIQKR